MMTPMGWAREVVKEIDNAIEPRHMSKAVAIVVLSYVEAYCASVRIDLEKEVLEEIDYWRDDDNGDR